MTHFFGLLRFEYTYACRSCGTGPEQRMRWIHWWPLDQRLVQACPQCNGANVEIVRIRDLYEAAA